MKNLIGPLMENLSGKDSFRFALKCSECKKLYRSREVPFSKTGVVPETGGKQIIFKAMYEREMKDARILASEELSEHMNLCPICGRLVCNRCFWVCEDLDMCSGCAERLSEAGTPVISDVRECLLPVSRG